MCKVSPELSEIPNEMSSKCELHDVNPMSDHFEQISENFTTDVTNENLLVETVFKYLPVFMKCPEYLAYSQRLKTSDNYFSSSLNSLLQEKDFTTKEIVNFIDHERLNSRGLPYMSPTYLKEIMKSYYLYNFIRAAENLPIGVTICKVNKRKDHIIEFPIVYVNQMYSAMTGHNHKDMLDQDFADFRKIWTINNKESNRDLFDHLRQGKSYMCKINDCNKNEIPFSQLIGIRPILDSKKKYRYVIVLHIDTTLEQEIEANKKMMYNLLLKVPRRLNSLDLPILKENEDCQ